MEIYFNRKVLINTIIIKPRLMAILLVILDGALVVSGYNVEFSPSVIT